MKNIQITTALNIEADSSGIKTIPIKKQRATTPL